MSCTGILSRLCIIFFYLPNAGCYLTEAFIHGILLLAETINNTLTPSGIKQYGFRNFHPFRLHVSKSRRTHTGISPPSVLPSRPLLVLSDPRIDSSRLITICAPRIYGPKRSLISLGAKERSLPTRKIHDMAKKKKGTSSAFQGSHGQPQVSEGAEEGLIGVLSNEPVSFGPLHNGQRDQPHLPDPGDKEANLGGHTTQEDLAPVVVADESVVVSLDENVISVHECCFSSPPHRLRPVVSKRSTPTYPLP